MRPERQDSKIRNVITVPKEEKKLQLPEEAETPPGIIHQNSDARLLNQMNILSQ